MRPANFLRDTVFGGNEMLYDIASTVTDIVFDDYFELASHNRRDGGKDHNDNRITYDAPEPNGKPEAEGASDCKS